MTSLTVNEVYAIGAPIILAMILVEVFISNIRNSALYRQGDTLCTMGLLTGNMLMSFAVKGGILAFHFFLYDFRVLDLAGILPRWAKWVFTFIFIDLIFYMYHRLSHRVRFLWAVHMSHHSSEEMNFAVSFRQAWFGPISKVPFFMIMPILGFDPTIIAVAGVISTLWGFVEYIFNTPSHHRVHHGSNPQYIDKNYGNLLIIWDKMFGSFEPEKKPVVFGLVNNVNTFNPIKITFMGWMAMLKDMRNSLSYKESLKIFFGPPNTKTRSGSF